MSDHPNPILVGGYSYTEVFPPASRWFRTRDLRTRSPQLWEHEKIGTQWSALNPIVGIVMISSSASFYRHPLIFKNLRTVTWSLYKIVVFPALSKPRMRIRTCQAQSIATTLKRTSFEPKTLWKILLRRIPCDWISACAVLRMSQTIFFSKARGAVLCLRGYVVALDTSFLIPSPAGNRNPFG